VKNNIKIYDSTLRDGAQTKGVAFSFQDKIRIAEKLDSIGVDYIEGGWPGANPTDDKFFNNVPFFRNSKIVAFGMTRRNSNSAENDPGLNCILNSGAKVACIVGKTWDFHVKKALNVKLIQNLEMIGDTIEYSKLKMNEVMFDAEHFFDGYKANPKYAIESLKVAFESGADWIILCDTNGGTLPHELKKILNSVFKVIPKNQVGVHFHNDTDNATANSIESVIQGVCQVQGTFNGLGERCGNANLVNVVTNLCLKLNYNLKIKKNLKKITQLSRFIDETLNRKSERNLPFVGSAAFAHKGGLHISAVKKDPKSYEHMNPKLVGNERILVVSNQSGTSNIVEQLTKLHITVKKGEKNLKEFLEIIKKQEFLGYAYDGAEASFELLARRKFDQFQEFYELKRFKVSNERVRNADNKFDTISLAEIAIKVENKSFRCSAKGLGPINALDKSLRKALTKFYPKLSELNLVDYKVRILTPQDGTKALVRVRIESSAKENTWSTIGVSDNVIDASYIALNDSITYHLMKTEKNS